jgi:hypothetical protein
LKAIPFNYAIELDGRQAGFDSSLNAILCTGLMNQPPSIELADSLVISMGAELARFPALGSVQTPIDTINSPRSQVLLTTRSSLDSKVINNGQSSLDFLLNFLDNKLSYRFLTSLSNEQNKFV